MPALSLLAVIPPALASSQANATATCPVISGYVYYDVNNNGLLDPGEPPIPGSPIALRNAPGALSGSVVTDANGYYHFDNDAASDAPTQTAAQAATFPMTTTDWSASKTLPQFDPSLGTLKSVTIGAEGDVTSTIKAESLDIDTATVTATVGGTLTITAPGGQKVVAAPSLQAGSFEAAAYDGASDYGGPSGHDFGSATAHDSASITLTGADVLPYNGTGQVSFDAAVAASSRTTGGGNVQNLITTIAGGQVTVRYQYVPVTCLHAGQFTITQTSEPPGYTDGQETSGNTSPIPNSRGTDMITVNLGGGDSPNNNFGELRSSIAGCVYVDDSDDGIKDPGEAPIPNVLITLSGDASKTANTGIDGCYRFIGLVAGSYTINETQPSAYLDGKDTIGSVGGQTTNDQHAQIPLPAATDAYGYNFGERYAPVPTPTPTQPPATTTPANDCVTGAAGCGANQGSTPTGTGVTLGEPPPGRGGSGTTDAATPARTSPAAPNSGSGLLERASDLNVILIGFAIFAASGWFAFLAIGARRNRDER